MKPTLSTYLNTTTRLESKISGNLTTSTYKPIIAGDVHIDESLFRFEHYCINHVISYKSSLLNIINKITSVLEKNNYSVKFFNETGIIAGIRYDAFFQYIIRYKLILLDDNHLDINRFDLNDNVEFKYSWNNMIDIIEEKKWAICYIVNEYGSHYDDIITNMYNDFGYTPPMLRSYHDINPFVISKTIFYNFYSKMISQPVYNNVMLEYDNFMNSLENNYSNNRIEFEQYDMMNDIKKIKYIIQTCPESNLAIIFNKLIESDYNEWLNQLDVNELAFLALLKHNDDIVLSVGSAIINKINLKYYNDEIGNLTDYDKQKKDPNLILYCALFDLEQQSNISFRSLPNMDNIIMFLNSLKSDYRYKPIHDKYKI